MQHGRLSMDALNIIIELAYKNSITDVIIRLKGTELEEQRKMVVVNMIVVEGMTHVSEIFYIWYKFFHDQLKLRPCFFP